MEILKRLDETKFEESTTHKKTNPTSFLCLRKKTCHLSFFRKNAYTSNHIPFENPHEKTRLHVSILHLSNGCLQLFYPLGTSTTIKLTSQMFQLQDLAILIQLLEA